MKKNTLTALTVFGVSATFLLVGNSAQANLIVNGDFEAGNTGFSSDYTFVSNNSSAQQYGIVTDPSPFNSNFSSFGDHTSGSGNMMVVNGAASANQIVWEQTVSVTPDTIFDFSIWVATAVPSNPPELEFLVNSASIGSFTASTTTGIWEEFATTWNSGTATLANITIIETSLQASGNDFALDDIAFSSPSATTPEPGTLLGLLVIGGVGLLTKRQKQN